MFACLYIFPCLVAVFASLVSASASEQIISTHAHSANTSRNLCQPVATCIEKLDAGEECDLLPVPENSYIPSPPPGSFLTTKLRRGVWMFYDGGHQAMILKTGPNLAVVDFPDASSVQLIEAVEKLLRGTVPATIDMVYSHTHYDHIGGATRFYNYMKRKYPDAFISIYGTAETSRAIRLSTSKRAIRPNKIVGRISRTLILSKSLQLQMHLIGGHTETDLLLYIPKVEGEASVAMFVDIVFPGWSPFFNLAITDDPREYLRSHMEILKFDFDIFLGGHVRVGNKDDVIRNMQFTRDLFAAGATALQSIGPKDFAAAGLEKAMDPSAPQYQNIWWVFGNVIRRLQVDACYRIMVEKWGCQLAGLDITLRSHCFLSVTYNIIDV